MKHKNYINKLEKYYLKPGYLYVTMVPTIISTILGSCISICMYDFIERYGGMNHYLYPVKKQNDIACTKYGDIAINTLIKTFLKFGSDKKNLYATIIGGAYFENLEESRLISEGNIKICKKILNLNNIKIIKEITGGNLGRRIDFLTEINEIKISYLKNKDI